MPDRWQGLDAEAGALLEALGCDSGRGEHDDVAAVLRRAFEAGAQAMAAADEWEMRVHYGPEADDRLIALPLPSPEEPSRG